jgi:5-methylcytosine-specific restriction protein B
MEELVDLVFDTYDDEWPSRAENAFEALFGSRGGRYRKYADGSVVKPRIPPNLDVPFAAFIHPSNPDSGAYGGMSFVLFPPTDEQQVESALFGLGLGTRGLSPDEQILSRAGSIPQAALTPGPFL